jgi:hypothetical protein
LLHRIPRNKDIGILPDPKPSFPASYIIPAANRDLEQATISQIEYNNVGRRSDSASITDRLHPNYRIGPRKEQRIMDEISRLFRGLYDQFLLRDVVAKVIPGLLPLVALSFLLPVGSSSGGISGYPLGMGSPLVNAIVFFGLGLMLGMLLQYIGNRTYTFGKRNVDWGPKTFKIRNRSFKLPRIKFSLPALDWTPIVIHVWGSEEESIKKELDFRHFAKQMENRDYVLNKRERLVVFKEMAGNYAVAFSLAFVISLVIWIINIFDDPDIFNIRSILFFVILWIILMVLSRQNKSLANQQKSWEKIVIESKGNLPLGAAKPAARTTRKAKS